MLSALMILTWVHFGDFTTTLHYRVVLCAWKEMLQIDEVINALRFLVIEIEHEV